MGIKSTVLIISPAFLKDNSVIDNNVDEKIITSTIVYVQDTVIQELVGTNLLEKIYNDITNSSLAGTYKDLVDFHLRWAILFYSIAELLEPLHYRVVTKGVVVKDSDSKSTSISEEFLYKLKASYLHKAEYYCQDTIKFIKANLKALPEFYKNTDADDVIPKHTSDHQPIFLYNGKRHIR